MPPDAAVLVELRTREFGCTIALRTDRAPVSCAYFLRDVDAGLYDGSSIFRIVTPQNQAADQPSKIAVIQMGFRETNAALAPSIRHEGTAVTGLRHRTGTVSLARFSPGAVYHSFFVCMRDEPDLDEGGARHPDGQGFAAFGKITRGFHHLNQLFEAHGSRPEYLTAPMVLSTIRCRRGLIG